MKTLYRKVEGSVDLMVINRRTGAKFCVEELPPQEVTVKDIDELAIKHGAFKEQISNDEWYWNVDEFTLDPFIAALHNLIGEKKEQGMNAYERAVNARIAYEFNCQSKYDRPGRPSLPIPKGERMEDYAMQFGTTEKEMRDCELEADRRIKQLGSPPKQ